MTTATRHREISAAFLSQAEDEFQEGQLLQASEKAWGAVAHYVKAISEDYGWNHQSHYLLRENAKRLIALTDYYNLNWQKLIVAEAMHVNFYEESLQEDDVRLGIDTARTLIDLLESVAPNANGQA